MILSFWIASYHIVSVVYQWATFHCVYGCFKLQTFNARIIISWAGISIFYALQVLYISPFRLQLVLVGFGACNAVCSLKGIHCALKNQASPAHPSPGYLYMSNPVIFLLDSGTVAQWKYHCQDNLARVWKGYEFDSQRQKKIKRPKVKSQKVIFSLIRYPESHRYLMSLFGFLDSFSSMGLISLHITLYFTFILNINSAIRQIIKTSYIYYNLDIDTF